MYNWYVVWGGKSLGLWNRGEVCACTLKVKGEIGLQFSEISWSEENIWLLESEIRVLGFDFNVPM